jgi:hypothetical protein
MRTGDHIVSNIYCKVCSSYIGWKYIKAFARSQQYKENKLIFELAYVDGDNLDNSSD